MSVSSPSDRHPRRLLCSWFALATTLWLVGGGCAVTPSPVVRLAPTGRPAAWAMGQPVIALDHKGVKVAAAFDHQQDAMVGVRIEIVNESDEAFTFDPAAATYLACVGERVPAAGASCWAKESVVDPEQLLLQLDLTHSRERAAQEGDEATGAVFSLLGAVGGVAATANGDHRGATRSFSSGARTSSAYGQSAASHGDRADRAIGTKQFLQGNILRKSTIQPGQGVAGTIYLPIVQNATLVTLNVAVKHATFRFPFHQTWYQP